MSTDTMSPEMVARSNALQAGIEELAGKIRTPSVDMLDDFDTVPANETDKQKDARTAELLKQIDQLTPDVNSYLDKREELQRIRAMDLTDGEQKTREGFLKLDRARLEEEENEDKASPIAEPTTASTAKSANPTPQPAPQQRQSASQKKAESQQKDKDDKPSRLKRLKRGLGLLKDEDDNTSSPQTPKSANLKSNNQ